LVDTFPPKLFMGVIPYQLDDGLQAKDKLAHVVLLDQPDVQFALHSDPFERDWMYPEACFERMS
jgi:hypothetical protein